jgi:hypothetical protein
LARKAFYGTGAAPLAVRHPGSVPPMVLSPWAAAVCALVLLQRRPALTLASAVSVVASDRLSRKLTRLRRPRRAAARLTVLGLANAVAQTATALTRHHWPLAAAACVFSARARRALVAAALVEGVADWWVHRGHHPDGPSLAEHLVAHRLDDLAYGAGLWWGAWRGRTTTPLRPAGAASTRSPGATAATRPVRPG